MTVHKTSCKDCQLEWRNPDNRDYSNDKCPQCGKKVEHTVERTVVVRSKNGILPRLLYAVEPPQNFE
jgi:PHP family Zn ribbon phosphoesterase